MPSIRSVQPAYRQLLFFMALAAGLRVAIWVVGGLVVQPSSDESITMLLAQQVTQGKWPLLFMGQPYLFPIESYLAAPLAWLPAGALASRLTSLILGLITTALALLLIPREGPRYRRWLGGLLAVVPSVYVVTLQGFYALPGYSFLMLVCLALPWLAIKSLHQDRPGYPFALGLLSGLGFAAHSLSLCASVPALLALFTARTNVRGIIVRFATTAFGLGIGILPYLIARWTIPDAHTMATETNSWPDIFNRWWSIGPSLTLPIAMGFRPTWHPTIESGGFILPLTGQAFSTAFGIFLTLAVLWRLAEHGTTLARRERPQLELADLLLGTILINLFLFAAAPRAHAGTARYLLPTALITPLLLAVMMAAGPRAIRMVGGLGALTLLFVQWPTGLVVAREWVHPDYALRTSVPDLQPALKVLADQDIHHAVASYGAAYRLTYLSRGQVIAAQPKNERFRNWPVPYQEEVQSAARVAFVLTESISFLKPSLFEQDLAAMKMSATIHTAGAFKVYADFALPAQPPSRLLPSSELTVMAPRQDVAPRLIDGLRGNPWRKKTSQCVGDAMSITWSQMRPLDHIMIHYGVRHDRPLAMNVAVRQQGAWQKPGPDFPATLQPFEFVHQQPRYETFVQRIEMNGELADGVRFQITKAREDRDWNIDEIEIYERLAASSLRDSGSRLLQPSG